MVSVSTFEELRQYFKCSNVKYNVINLLGVEIRQTFKIMLFAKNVYAFNYFHKKLHL